MFYISATFESIGNALAGAESGVFNESETKVCLVEYFNLVNMCSAIWKIFAFA